MISKWEEELNFQIQALQLPQPEREYRFHPVRRWRLDFAWPLLRFGVEVDGGVWRRGGGAHSHPLNIERDIEKSNELALLDWRVLRFTPKTIKSGEAVNMISAMLHRGT